MKDLGNLAELIVNSKMTDSEVERAYGHIKNLMSERRELQKLVVYLYEIVENYEEVSPEIYHKYVDMVEM